jgi:intracellular sulfur oxidation DsrE/DsrF family protein
MRKNVVAMAIAGLALLGSNLVFAADCPLEPYKDGKSHAFLPAAGPHSSGVYTSVDEEFGVGAQANTECVNKQGKLVIQVDAHKDASGAAPWLSTYGFFLRNYEIQGIEAGKDVEIAVVLSASGAYLGTNGNAITNPTTGTAVSNDTGNIARVRDAIARGFKVYVCQTAARGLGIKQSDLIEGVKFTPGGHLMVIDFQMNGYAHMIYK